MGGLGTGFGVESGEGAPENFQFLRLEMRILVHSGNLLGVNGLVLKRR